MHKAFAVTIRVVSCVICIAMLYMHSSCAYRYRSSFTEERALFHNSIARVAVVPFLDLTNTSASGSDVSDLFSSELARFREITIVHPSSIAKYLDARGVHLAEHNVREQALLIGDVFNVEAVIIGAVTEYDGFFPPVLGITVELVDVASGATLTSKTEVYDASFNYVRTELRDYASTREIEDSLFKEDIILQRMDLYIRFVCHQIIRKYL